MARQLAFQTPDKMSSAGSVFRSFGRGGIDLDKSSSGGKKKEAPPTEDGALSVRNVYPTLDIDEVLMGARKRRSLNGVQRLAIAPLP